jgi:3-mercaptopyruvate sulfurtransferase SseA
MGYANVRRYIGGKEDWKKAGLPLESDEDKHAA